MIGVIQECLELEQFYQCIIHGKVSIWRNTPHPAWQSAIGTAVHTIFAIIPMPLIGHTDL